MAATAPETTSFDTSRTTKDESLILFQPHLLSRIPRGWERAPTNAFTARLKGQKVWKRYPLRSDRPTTTTGAVPASEKVGPDDAPAGAGRAVKRLRVGEQLVPGLERPVADGQSYVGTLWGMSAGQQRRKLAPGRRARRDEVSRVSPTHDAPNKDDGAPHGAQGLIIEVRVSGHSPRPSGKGENSAGPMPVQTSAIEHNANIVDSTMLLKSGPKRLTGPKTNMAVHHDRRTVRDVRRTTITGMDLSRTPCKGSFSPSYRYHSKSVESKARRQMPSITFAQDRVQGICIRETAGEDPAAGMRGKKEMKSVVTEEAASSETRDINTPVTLAPEQVDIGSSGPVTKNDGSGVSSPSADVPFNNSDVSLSQVQAPSRVTAPCVEVRVGSRLSDDTNMLKDFLDRAKAKKAAMSPHMSAPARPASPSPAKSPRKVLAAVESNISSPKRSLEIANRPGTPPGKHTLESSDLDELDDGAVEPTSFRRSTRVRLPAPPRLARGTPSLIPVRRPTGSEPVVLQKSVAQDLAIMTRNNTRRNKGRSKPVDLRLQALAEEPMHLDSPVKQGRRGAKQVAWDETLVYQLEGGEAKAGEKKKKPKLRRVKGLGTANGTPAAKKEVTSASSHPARTLGNGRKGRMKT